MEAADHAPTHEHDCRLRLFSELLLLLGCADGGLLPDGDWPRSSGAGAADPNRFPALAAALTPAWAAPNLPSILYPQNTTMKITLVFDSTESAEDAYFTDFEDSAETWRVYLDARKATIEIERSSQDEPIDLELPVGVIAIIL